MVVLLVILALGFGYVIIVGMVAGEPLAWVIAAIVGIFAFLAKRQLKFEAQQKLEEEGANKVRFYKASKQYKDKLAELAIPENSHTIELVELPSKGAKYPMDIGVHKIWKDNSEICLFKGEPDISNYSDYFFPILQVIRIPITDIEYFSTVGEVYRETKIEGGGGGGTSVGGALIGGALAGEAGAIIGSRKQVDSIKSETITHDTRKTEFSIKDGEGGAREIFYFTPKSYTVFKDLIPEKEWEIVNELNKQKILAGARNESETLIEQLKAFAQLRSDGIITEDEFQEQKAKMLQKIHQ